jgi:hypothetical protein
VFTGTDPLTGNPRQAARTFHGTKKQADSALAELVGDMTRGNLTTDASTVGEYLDRWLDHVSVSMTLKAVVQAALAEYADRQEKAKR